MFTNSAYDRAKWVALVALPATATFYAAIASVWGWPYTVEVVATLTAGNALLGALLGLSSAKYQAGLAPTEGEAEPKPTNFGGTRPTDDAY